VNRLWNRPPNARAAKAMLSRPSAKPLARALSSISCRAMGGLWPSMEVGLPGRGIVVVDAKIGRLKEVPWLAASLLASLPHARARPAPAASVLALWRGSYLPHTQPGQLVVCYHLYAIAVFCAVRQMPMGQCEQDIGARWICDRLADARALCPHRDVRWMMWCSGEVVRGDCAVDDVAK